MEDEIQSREMQSNSFWEKKKKNNSQFYISMTDLNRLVLIRNKILGLSYKLSVKVAV